jgi:biotin carboxylase
MNTPIVILIGSAIYSHTYAQFLKEQDENAKLLVIDKQKEPRVALPDNAIYLKVPVRNTLSKVVSYCIKNKLNVTAVINRLDFFEILHGQLAETFNVPGPTAFGVRSLADKAQMHEIMMQHDLSFYRPRTIVSTLDEVPQHFDQLQFPVVLKTHTGAKSRGVVPIKSKADFEGAKKILFKALKDPKNDAILIEQYLYGEQVSPVMYVDNKGKVRILALVDIVTAREVKQKHMQLMYRTTPSKHSERVRQKIAFVMQTLVNATGLKSVLLHPEFFVINKHVFLIEVNVRMGGFRETMMKLAYDIDMNKLSWDLAFDNPISDEVKSSFSCTACEVWEDTSGKIKKFAIPDSKYITEKKLYMKAGDTYIAPPKKQNPLALFYVKTPDDSLSVTKKIRKKTTIEFTK